MSGLLKKTKLYQAGHMEFADGRDWRNKLKEDFADMGLVILDPYNHQFVNRIDESPEQHARLYKMREEGDYENLAGFCKQFRVYDLNCVDRADFIVWNLDITVPTIGSVEEFVAAVKMKKPSYVIVKQGKRKCPLWIYGMIPHKYIMNSVEEFVQKIRDIDNGTTPMDERWKLFNMDIR